MEQQMIFSVSEANNFIKALLDRVPQLSLFFALTIPLPLTIEVMEP